MGALASGADPLVVLGIGARLMAGLAGPRELRCPVPLLDDCIGLVGAVEVSVGRVLRHDAVLAPAEYARLLLDAGWTADVWETTYLHVLTGPDPVLEWMRGTGLRPILQALSASDGADFIASYAAALREAYPAEPGETLFPFRRIFAVGHRL